MFSNDDLAKRKVIVIVVSLSVTIKRFQLIIVFVFLMKELDFINNKSQGYST